MHPFCRCSDYPYIPGRSVGVRAARDPETGKSIKVPGDMTYKQWYEKFVDNSDNSDIIRINEDLEVSDVHYVGKIDKKIYSCITNDITTDEVIITDRQIEHIAERHKGVFENIKPFINEILNNPDYILADKNHENTALILKSINRAGTRFQLVLRLHTSLDEDGFKNSIISAWEISESRWNSYLKNRKILYKNK